MTKTRALITVDTEIGETAKFTSNGFDKFVLGSVDGKEFGVPEIRRELERYGVPGEFFVDVYEADYYDESKYERLCRRLDSNGHGVQLHTHPSYKYDRGRANMYEYSQSEQKTILSDGIAYFEEWLGQPPVAHRAGGYGANDETLRALDAVDISIDSSYFHRQENCNLMLDTINDPVVIHDVLQIPVTSLHPFKRIAKVPLPYRASPLKLDVNWLSPKTMQSSLTTLLGEHPFLVVFLHSGSFVRRSDDGQRPVGVDEEAWTTFRAALEFLTDHDIEITTFETIQAECQVAEQVEL